MNKGSIICYSSILDGFFRSPKILRPLVGEEFLRVYRFLGKLNQMKDADVNYVELLYTRDNGTNGDLLCVSQPNAGMEEEIRLNYNFNSQNRFLFQPSKNITITQAVSILAKKRLLKAPTTIFLHFYL